jgi:catechol 2,3-dioxygenase-like lactoylglutathione lyase family enzyme
LSGSPSSIPSSVSGAPLELRPSEGKRVLGAPSSILLRPSRRGEAGGGLTLAGTVVIVIAAALVGAAGAAWAAVVEVERISLTAADLDRTERFYRDGLGFVTVGRRHVEDPAVARLFGVAGAVIDSLVMRVGSDKVEFLQYHPPGRPYPEGSRSPDLWFQHFAIVVSNMDAAFERLHRVALTPISSGGPQTLPEQNGRVRAFKFRDPDGHPLELLYFPPRQGRPLWHRSDDGRVFLGIDHSAIDVSDTTASEAFYGGLLGMTIAYEVTNRGPIQDALDGTKGTVVRITGLRPGSPNGPGIEFLDYRAPSAGRPTPADTASNDIVHAHLVLRVDDLAWQVHRLDDNHVRFVSPGIVALGDGTDAAMVRDPDGHVLLLEEPAHGQ